MTGIVILNYNNAGYTLDCLASIRKYNTSSVRIIVVDNASNDDSVKVLSDHLSLGEVNFQLVVSTSNVGYAQGNNLGLKVLAEDESIDKVLVLNNDVLFTEDIIPVLERFLDSNPDAGLVSPLLKCRDGMTPDSTCARKDCSIQEIIWTYILYFTNICGILSHFSNKRKMLLISPGLLKKESVEIELPSGSCMMIRKSLFKEIGWFDPNTFLYYEENILYRKLLAVGKINYMLPAISCIHLGGVTTNKVPHNAAYMKTSKASGYYYATHYRDLNTIQKLILKLSYSWYNCLVHFVKAIKRHG